MLITDGRRSAVDLKSILKFVTENEKESFLGFKLHPNLFFIKTNKKNIFLVQQYFINPLNLPRATAEYNLPDEKNLFNLYDKAFVNQYFRQQ